MNEAVQICQLLMVIPPHLHDVYFAFVSLLVLRLAISTLVQKHLTALRSACVALNTNSKFAFFVVGAATEQTDRLMVSDYHSKGIVHRQRYITKILKVSLCLNQLIFPDVFTKIIKKAFSTGIELEKQKQHRRAFIYVCI